MPSRQPAGRRRYSRFSAACKAAIWYYLTARLKPGPFKSALSNRQLQTSGFKTAASKQDIQRQTIYRRISWVTNRRGLSLRRKSGHLLASVEGIAGKKYYTSAYCADEVCEHPVGGGK